MAREVGGGGGGSGEFAKLNKRASGTKLLGAMAFCALCVLGGVRQAKAEKGGQGEKERMRKSCAMGNGCCGIREQRPRQKKGVRGRVRKAIILNPGGRFEAL